MKRLSKKDKRSGFTLAELLIVVGIIGVLVAIAIPIFSNQLEKSREAYDIYTMRQAASAAIDLYYAGISDKNSAEKAGLTWWLGNGATDNAAGAYDPGTGKILPKRNGLTPYGKGTTRNGGTKYTLGNQNGAYAPDQDYTNAVVMVAIYPKANPARVDVFWKNNVNNDTTYVGGEGVKNAPKYSSSIPLN